MSGGKYLYLVVSVSVDPLYAYHRVASLEPRGDEALELRRLSETAAFRELHMLVIDLCLFKPVSFQVLFFSLWITSDLLRSPSTYCLLYLIEK